MKRWIVAAIAVVFALSTAIALGFVGSDRQEPIITYWAAPGETQEALGMEFELVSLSAVDYEPQGISDPVPAGAVAVVAEIRQQIGEVPADPYDLVCEVRLHNGPDSWYPSFDVGSDLELEPDCHRVDGEDVTPGLERMMSVGWIVPEAALDGARVAIRLYGVERDGIGFSTEG